MKDTSPTVRIGVRSRKDDGRSKGDQLAITNVLEQRPSARTRDHLVCGLLCRLGPDCGVRSPFPRDVSPLRDSGSASGCSSGDSRFCRQNPGGDARGPARRPTCLHIIDACRGRASIRYSNCEQLQPTPAERILSRDRRFVIRGWSRLRLALVYRRKAGWRSGRLWNRKHWPVCRRVSRTPDCGFLRVAEHLPWNGA